MSLETTLVYGSKSLRDLWNVGQIDRRMNNNIPKNIIAAISN